MKNFNIYDPMKKGQGLVLDGQTLAHIEVSAALLEIKVSADWIHCRSWSTVMALMMEHYYNCLDDALLLQVIVKLSLLFFLSEPCFREETVPYLVMHATARGF